MICQQVFVNYGAGNFPLKFFLKSASMFFSLWRRDPVLELQCLLSVCTRKFLCVKTSLCKSLLLWKLGITK